MDLEYFSFGLDIGQGIFIDVFTFGGGLHFHLFFFLIVLVEEGVLEVGNGDAVSFEEPFFELLDHVCFEGSDIFVQLDYFVSDEFYLLEGKFVVTFAHFFLFYQLELLLVNDIFGELFRSFALLLLMQFA